MDDLESLRKRAKQLVRQHRAGTHTVAQRIRALPRFAGMDDRSVLAADFRLHDAHELLAVEHGFSTWAELKETPPMTQTDATESLVLERAFAQVFVRDVAASAAWYRDVLGFATEFTYGEPPFYAQVARDGVAFNLRHTDESPWRHPAEEDLLAVRIDTSDCKALYLEIKDRADVAQAPRLEPWGQVTMVVRDPDGNLLGFGSR